MHQRRYTPWPALVVLALGCSEPTPDTPEDAGISAPLDPVVCRPGYYTEEEQPITLLSDGDSIVLRYAPQGGHVMWVGARVVGLLPGPARVEARLVDPETLETHESDSRTIELVAASDGSGELEPDARSNSSFAHLVACPNYGTRPVEGVEWILELDVADAENPAHVGTTSIRVIPTCAEGWRQENCQCECAPGYTFGKCGAPT